MTASNKCTLDEVEEMLVDTFATATYRISTKKVCNNDNSTSQSTQDPERSSAPK